mgnify:CR=1 FL=1
MEQLRDVEVGVAVAGSAGNARANNGAVIVLQDVRTTLQIAKARVAGVISRNR